jgi:type VI secretion system secreted protein Hcp
MALNCFLTLSNGIKGESQDADHLEWIDVHSWNWGMTQSGTTHEGAGAGGGRVEVNDITFTKYVDQSTHDLIKRCCSGDHIASGQLVVRKAGGAAPVNYLVIDFEEVLISSYQTGGSNDGLDRVTETIGLNFRRFHVTYTKQNVDGSPGPEFPAGWEIAMDEEWSV